LSLALTESVQFTFGFQPFSKISSSLAAFTALVQNTTQNLLSYTSNTTVNVSQTASGYIGVTLTFSNYLAVGDISASVGYGEFGFVYNSSTFVATFDLTYGPCPEGSVSSNGNQPDCMTCRANTYVRVFILLLFLTSKLGFDRH
jgi:hypothetical protein